MLKEYIGGGGFTHLFVHFNVKAVGHLVILKQIKNQLLFINRSKNDSTVNLQLSWRECVMEPENLKAFILLFPYLEQSQQKNHKPTMSPCKFGSHTDAYSLARAEMCSSVGKSAPSSTNRVFRLLRSEGSLTKNTRNGSFFCNRIKSPKSSALLNVNSEQCFRLSLRTNPKRFKPTPTGRKQTEEMQENYRRAADLTLTFT